VRLAGRFLLVWLAGSLVLAAVPAIERLLVRATVLVSAWQSRLIGMHPVVVGDELFLGGSRAVVSPECTSLLPSLILLAVIAVYPASHSQRLRGLAIALPLFWVFNQMRIGVLVALLAQRPEAFELVHSVVWQAASLIAMVALALGWMRAVERARTA
jgi:exosortase/archaeosortase family protein